MQTITQADAYRYTVVSVDLSISDDVLAQMLEADEVRVNLCPRDARSFSVNITRQIFRVREQVYDNKTDPDRVRR